MKNHSRKKPKGTTNLQGHQKKLETKGKESFKTRSVVYYVWLYRELGGKFGKINLKKKIIQGRVTKSERGKVDSKKKRKEGILVWG